MIPDMIQDDIITDSVSKIEEVVRNSGCEDGGVLLETAPGCIHCQYDHGACMVSSFGGKTAEFVMHDPVNARTKISFMFGVPLPTPPMRGAACAIINIVCGFLSMTRIHRSCPAGSHGDCAEALKQELEGKTVWCPGDIPAIGRIHGDRLLAGTPDGADIILTNSDGLISDSFSAAIRDYRTTKRILCLGPSTAGVSRLQGLEHFCPFGVRSGSGSIPLPHEACRMQDR
jgi:hypothetical protein